MLTLYTGIGHLTIQRTRNGKRLPVILMNQQEYALTEPELLLWSLLAFQILTQEELTTYFSTEMKRQNLSDTPDFSHYLRRLLLRGIVAEGTGVTAVDALYRLLSQMHITPVKESFPLRLWTCLKLWGCGHLPLSMFPHYLKKPKNQPLELLILRLSSRLSFSVAELLSCMDISDAIPSQDDIDRICNCIKTGELAEQTALHHTQYPVLQSVANLYLKKQIILDK